MKPAVFEYYHPTTVADALGALRRHEGRARVLAGGQSLVPMLNMRLWKPDALVDINDIDELDSIEARQNGVVLGALVRYSTIERSALLADRLPLLPQVVTHIGDRQVRNRGTIGGALAHGDPTGEMALACLALEATILAAGAGGVRRVPVTSLYVGSYATVLDPTEIVTGVEFPRPPAHFAFAEICRRHNDFAVVSAVALGDRAADGTWDNLRIALGGVADTAVRATAAERLLAGSAMSDEQIAAAAGSVAEIIDPPADIRASAEYRAHLAPVHLRRVLTQLRDSAVPAAPGGNPADAGSQEKGN